jgi:hypothetical protein
VGSPLASATTTWPTLADSPPDEQCMLRNAGARHEVRRSSIACFQLPAGTLNHSSSRGRQAGWPVGETALPKERSLQAEASSTGALDSSETETDRALKLGHTVCPARAPLRRLRRQFSPHCEEELHRGRPKVFVPLILMGKGCASNIQNELTAEEDGGRRNSGGGGRAGVDVEIAAERQEAWVNFEVSRASSRRLLRIWARAVRVRSLRGSR